MFDASPVFDAHDELARLQAEASVASTSLALNPEGERSVHHWRTGLRFVRAALDHMREEEEGSFLAAARAGLPARALETLRFEHACLRVLAAELLAQPAPDDESALALVRFLHRFERHVADEEFTLSK